MNESPTRLELSVLPEQFAVTQLAANAPLPPWSTQGSFFSITRTGDELSVVCAVQHVPEQMRGEICWRALKVRGPFALSEIGVLASLATPLADAKISLLAISTFATDYLLVSSEQLRAAVDTLQRAGHKIYEAGLVS
jgi:hypothetical protein